MKQVSTPQRSNVLRRHSAPFMLVSISEHKPPAGWGVTTLTFLLLMFFQKLEQTALLQIRIDRLGLGI
jgi:hypothetical protein